MSTFCVRTQTLVHALKHIFRFTIFWNCRVPLNKKNPTIRLDFTLWNFKATSLYIFHSIFELYGAFTYISKYPLSSQP